MDFGYGKYFPIHPSLLFGRMAELADTGNKAMPDIEAWEDVFPIVVPHAAPPSGASEM